MTQHVAHRGSDPSDAKRAWYAQMREACADTITEQDLEAAWAVYEKQLEAAFGQRTGD